MNPADDETVAKSRFDSLMSSYQRVLTENRDLRDLSASAQAVVKYASLRPDIMLPLPRSGPCVYVLRTAAGAILYVGVTDNALVRLGQHGAAQEWWQSASTADLYYCLNRRQADKLERDLIAFFNPVHNRVRYAS